MRPLGPSSANQTWSRESTIIAFKRDFGFFPGGTAFRVYAMELGSNRPSMPVSFSLTHAIPWESTAMSWASAPDGRENSIVVYLAATPWSKVEGKFLLGWEGPLGSRSCCLTTCGFWG